MQFNSTITDKSASIELSDKLKGNPIIKEQHSGEFTESGLEIHYYDEKTTHGLHYTEEEFYDEAERRYNTFCNHFPKQAADAERITFVMNTFEDWNNPDDERMMHFLRLYNDKISGYVSIDTEEEMPDSADWQPIHGIGLLDYAQAAKLSQNNVTDTEICAALGIEKPIWDEVSVGWNNRLGTNGREMFDAYMRFQTQEIQHAGLQKLVSDAPSSEHVELLMNDDFFWAEINAIMFSAGNYGIDAIQYVWDKFKISMGDYSASCMAFDARNPGGNKAANEYMEEKMKEYGVIFSKEVGGDVAGDVEF